MNIVYNLALSIPAIRRLRQGRDALLRANEELTTELRNCQSDLAASRSRPVGTEPSSLLTDPGSPFFHYNTIFDVEQIIRRHAPSHVQLRPGHLTNFLGVAINPKFFPQLLDGRAGEVEGIPIPGNWHADMAEFGAALRAVELARDTFTVVELGCGWGCWMNITGTAARRVGLDVNLIGVEGDRGHIDFAREACRTNGFDDTQVTLYHGIAAPSSGTALFPRQERAGVSWGLQPIFGATERQRLQAIQSGDYDELPMLALEDVVTNHPRIDFLHVDIQGGEADLIASCLPLLERKVAYMFIGTHSRQIEGRLFDILLRSGWRLEIERPGMLKLDSDTPYTWIDGVQGWRNIRLLPEREDRPMQTPTSRAPTDT